MPGVGVAAVSAAHMGLKGVIVVPPLQRLASMYDIRADVGIPLPGDEQFSLIIKKRELSKQDKGKHQTC